MKRTLTVILATFFVASGANALSLTIDTDKDTYLVGETITITATLDTAGAPAGSQLVNVSVNWDSAVASALGIQGTFTLGSSSQIITAGQNAGNSNLTSFGGAVPWTGPPSSGCVLLGGGAGNTCILLNQTQLAGAFQVDSSILVGTLELLAGDVGLLNFTLPTVDAFGAAAAPGTNFLAAEVVPEPTTAALFGLGLLGLAVAGRRR